MKNPYYSYIQEIRSLLKIEHLCVSDSGRNYEKIYDGPCIGIHDFLFP
jgi:hypothetical protein